MTELDQTDVDLSQEDLPERTDPQADVVNPTAYD